MKAFLTRLWRALVLGPAQSGSTSAQAGGAKTKEDLMTQLAASARNSICFRRRLPDVHFDGLSFFGGLPVGPKDFDWPRSVKPQSEEGDPYGISFLGQVNLAELPAFDGRDVLPADGVLYFFRDWGMDSGDEFKTFSHLIRYHRGDVSTFAEIAPPPDLCPIYGRHDRSAYDHNDWQYRADHNGLEPLRTFPKTPVEPAVFRTFALPDWTGEDQSDYFQLCEDEVKAGLMRALGEAEDPNEGLPEDRTAVWQPSPAFPEYWFYIEVAAGHILQNVRVVRERPDGDAAEAARAWVRRGRAEGLFTPVPEADAAAFRKWLESLSQQPAGPKPVELNFSIHAAIKVATPYLLSHSVETASHIGPELRRLVVLAHPPLTHGNDYIRHQMLGTGKIVQNAPYEQQGKRLLLMQFDSDPAMNWMWWDVGVIQYWITPDDLKARRCDRVIVTIEGH